MKLSKQEQWEIITYYIPNIKVKKKILSPFRNERNPSCVLYEDRRADGFVFYDFGIAKPFSCIDLVMTYENCDYKQAVKIIGRILYKDEKFFTNPKRPEYVNGQYKNILQRYFEHKTEEVIDLSPKAFSFDFDVTIRNELNEKEMEWMDTFNISTKVATQNNFFPLQQYTIYYLDSSYTYQSSDDDIIFGIFNEDKTGFKAYHPYNTKRKWRSYRLNNSFIFGYDRAKQMEDTPIVLCAGNKDTLILQSMGYRALCLNSETKIPDSEMKDKIIDLVNVNYLNIIYDWDATGIFFSHKIATIFDTLRVNLIDMRTILSPLVLEDTKDIGDLAVKEYLLLFNTLKTILK